MAVAGFRAISAIDARKEIRGNDYLAEIFLPEERKLAMKNPALLKEIATRSPGMYEYVIARTAYLDNITEQALKDSIPQIVFLGAGYDSRPYRFKDQIKGTRIFEVDIETTQKHKMQLLSQAKIPIPGQVIFVSINFNTETLENVLFKAGYEKDKKTLFIWEGVTYYLASGTVDDTLNFIKSNSSPGSSICFDYAASWPDMINAYGVKEAVKTMSANASGEPIRFAIARGKIEPFLAERGYKLIEHLTPEDMEARFLTLQDGSSAGKVIGHLCFAHASVAE
jgi:methyltransferase (TIGR00027 family)